MQDRVRAYYQAVVDVLPKSEHVHCISVNHTAPNSTLFVNAISKIVTVDAILAKPSSYDLPERRAIQNSLNKPIRKLDRDELKGSEWLTSLISETGAPARDIVLADIGGYFSPFIDTTAGLYSGRILGVLEGTENGALRYEANLPRSVPVMTVARSPLKLPEDHLVGAGVVFSVEAVLRELVQVLQTQRACVIGYGKIGRGVAEALRGRGVPTAVYDNDPVKRAEAAARGYQIYPSLTRAISNRSLVISATGKNAIGVRDLESLTPNAILATVTSADDELSFGSLQHVYDGYEVTDNLWQYVSKADPEKSFYLVGNGRPANFLHGAVLGPALELISGEKLAAIACLAQGKTKPDSRLIEVSHDLRKNVAEIWTQFFVPEL
ncbi:NAD(P)-dependent oxidoreductase [Antrihabitans sp. NCIMB 15449]|uniref:NAD(P)-dependent oxidoreductase n=1 Tax=Antrihabitans spumae TaxID=3373370 RepID=A0ABW7JJD7_9NOCA